MVFAATTPDPVVVAAAPGATDVVDATTDVLDICEVLVSLAALDTTTEFEGNSNIVMDLELIRWVPTSIHKKNTLESARSCSYNVTTHGRLTVPGPEVVAALISSHIHVNTAYMQYTVPASETPMLSGL